MASPQERAAVAPLAPAPVVATVQVVVVAQVAEAAVVVVAAEEEEEVVVAVVEAVVEAADSVAHVRPGPSCRSVEAVPSSRR